MMGEMLGEWTGASATGNVTMNVHKTPRASLGHVNLREGAPAALTDLSWITPFTGYEIKGILGMDFLGSHIVQINFDVGKVSFLRSLASDPGVAVPLIIEDDQPPMVDVKVSNWGKEKFIIDSGAVFVSGAMTKDLFVRLVRNGKLKVVGGGMGIGLAGEREGALGRLDRIQLSEFEHADLIFDCALFNHLGLHYLSRYEITFDFPNRKMYLKKGPRFPATDEFDMSGISLVRRNGETIVEEVAEGSPAAQAGIRPKDRVVKVGDKSTSDTSLYDFHRLLASRGKVITVHLSRPGEDIQMPLVLRDYGSNYAAAWEASLENQENKSKPEPRTRGRLVGRRR